MTPYRAPLADDTEEIDLAPARKTWLLVFCLPMLASLLMTAAEGASPTTGHVHLGLMQRVTWGQPSSSGDFCETLHSSAILDPTPLHVVIFGIGLWALGTVALHRNAGARVVIDRRTRVIRVIDKGVEQSAVFNEKPTIIMRNDVYTLHVGRAQPIMLAPSTAPRSKIEALKLALSTLDRHVSSQTLPDQV